MPIASITDIALSFALIASGLQPVNREKGGERKEKKKERRKGEPVGIHRHFDCSSFIIYAGSSINFTRTTTTTKTKIYELCGLSGNLLETRISSSLWMH